MSRDDKKKEFINILLDWFKENKRNYEWRKTKDPYEIAIAEILLQRTRSDNVVVVYGKFIKKFPSIYALYSANEEEIKFVIKKLGLYNIKSKILKNFARKIVEDYKGDIPLSENELLNIKGLGNYISRAVLCFTDTEDKAVVDSNVARIIKRVFGYKMSSSPHKDKDFLEFMQELLPRNNAKEFNWALFDFGAKICKPQNPNCDKCVLISICEKQIVK